MHLTTMQLIFGPKVDIQHFNVSSCQQLASSSTMPHCCSWSFQRWIFNILMCPLANNWPPQYYAPHYYATDLWSQGGLFNILMCPLANNWPPQYYASLLCNDLWSKVDIQHFNVSSCQQLASQYYAPHYYATDLWLKVDIQHFNVSSCQQLASSILCTHYYAADLLVQVDVQHLNVSSCQQLASSVLFTSSYYAADLCPRWIFNILMCPLANNWPPQYYASLLCSWSLVQGGYSTF
jgi:hypothetical protein